jgi:RHS repeat-associated protein
MYSASGITGSVEEDRNGTDLSALARFLPYGEEITSTASDRMKFATYTRDSFTALDNADQRYYASSYGRFNTADQYMASTGPSDPGSWNRYAYVTGDPVNNYDSQGLANCSAGDPLPCTVTIKDTGPVYGPGGPFGAGTADGYGGQPPFWDGYASKAAFLRHIQCTPVLQPVDMPSDELQTMISQTNAAATAALQGADNDGGAAFVVQMVQFFRDNFRVGGPWDFKENYADPTTHDVAKNFGNFAFGAVMQSFGLSYRVAQSAAGLYQIYLCQSGGACGAGTLFTYPFGDQANDAAMIQKGYLYQSLQGSGQCPPE